jgi:uncharacterized protein (DUF952 family)
MALIFHVTTSDAWNEALVKGSYRHPSLEKEGFIHCCEERQLPGVLERYFAGMRQLIRLAIDTDKLKSKWLMEWSPATADHFPHIYGPLNPDAVTMVLPI